MADITSGAGLIGTKCSRPGNNQYLISRRRLHQKLDNSLKSKLTMVLAPTGYGKTTAVLEWLGKCGLPAAWLSVDSRDNNPVVFKTHTGNIYSKLGVKNRAQCVKLVRESKLLD